MIHAVVPTALYFISVYSFGFDDLNIHDFCPVSSSYRTSETSIFTYPVSKEIAQRTQNFNLTYQCNTYPYNGDQKFCINQLTSCPVSEESHKFYLEYSKPGNNRDSFCQYFSNILLYNISSPESSQKIRIIAFGGSVTKGKLAGGCCCDHDLKCTATELHKICKKGYKTCRSETCNFCSWVRFIFDWMKISFPSTDILTLNLAEDGYSSKRMAGRLVEKMSIAGIKSFTSSDLVILDHSANDYSLKFTSEDGYINTDYETSKTSSVSMETLVREVLRNSIGTGPSMVYIDSVRVRGDSSYHFSRVAAHYNIHLWSFNNVVLNNQDLMNEAYVVRKSSDTFAHPFWPTHLLWADYFGAALTNEFRRCKEAKLFRGSSALMLRDVETADSGNVIPRLPPLIDVDAHMVNCMVGFPHIIDMNARVMIDAEIDSQNTVFGNIGTCRSEPSSSWPLKADRADAYGWISEGPHSFNTSLQFNHLVPLHSTLRNVYSFNHSVLRVEYLRTYKNAGIADVFLCGELVTVIDALWTEYFEKRISLPEELIIIHAMNASNDGYHYCGRGKDVPVVEFRHRKVAREGIESFEFKEMEARGQQKVRIIGVKLCLLDETNMLI